MVLEMDHLDLTAVFGHEDIYIAVHRVTVVTATDYLKYAGSLTAHIVETGKEVEFLQTGDAQHKPSNLSTRCLNP